MEIDWSEFDEEWKYPLTAGIFFYIFFTQSLIPKAKALRMPDKISVSRRICLSHTKTTSQKKRKKVGKNSVGLLPKRKGGRKLLKIA